MQTCRRCKNEIRSWEAWVAAVFLAALRFGVQAMTGPKPVEAATKIAPAATDNSTQLVQPMEILEAPAETIHVYR
ncbi:MAG: hypothetical protein ACI9WU_000874 [Myxococcota bacterium]|jgi:hypothetical protein